MAVEICDPSMQSLYQDLLTEFPKSSPEAIEASLQILRIAANIHVRLESLFSEFGLSSGRFSLLMLLRQEPTKQLPPSEIASRAQVSRSTMTQFLDHLERDDLVKRFSDPQDRRALLVQLTPKAEAILKKIIPVHLKYLEHLTLVLSRAERKQLFQLMAKCMRE